MVLGGLKWGLEWMRCSRSIALLVQKSNRVQLKLSDCLAQAETAIKALESVSRRSDWPPLGPQKALKRLKTP